MDRRNILNVTVRVGIMVGIAGMLTACDPIIVIAGAYFPAWIICALAAIVITSGFHLVMDKVGLDAYLVPRGLVYLAFFTAASLLVWLLFFIN